MHEGQGVPYPAIYSPSYSYTDYSTAQGDGSFPGQQIDNDIAGLSASLHNLATFVQGVMRSDGALQNEVVTFDSLSVDLQTAGLAPAENWAPGKSYVVKQGVTAGIGVYRATTPHISGASFEADLASGLWVLAVTLPIGPQGERGERGEQGEQGEAGPAAWGPPTPWSTGQSYTAIAPRSTVVEDGETYVAQVDHVSGVFAADVLAGKWVKVASKGPAGAGTGDMLRSANLADLYDKAVALSNLGVTAKGRGLVASVDEEAMRSFLSVPRKADALLVNVDGGYSSAQMQQARANILTPSVEAAAGLGLVFDPFFEVSQENVTTLLSVGASSKVYPADAAACYNGVASGFVMSAQNVVNPASGVADYKRLQGSTKAIVTTAKASLATGDRIAPHIVSITGKNFDSLGWGTDAARDVDVLAIVLSNWTGAIQVYCNNGARNRSQVKTAALTSGAVTPILLSFSGDQGGAWASGIDLAAEFGIGGLAGATYQHASLDTWATGSNLISHASATPWQASVGNFVQVLYFNVFPKGVLPWTSAGQITGEALHRLLSMRRTYADRLVAAQDYWWCSNAAAPKGAGVGTVGGVASSAQSLMCNVSFFRQMRTTPNVSFWNNGAQNQLRTTSTGSIVSAAMSVGGLSARGFGYCATSTAVLSPGAGYDFDVIANARP